jgi:hypothetical protein
MTSTTSNTFLKDLGNGLILRRASVEDTDELVAFNSEIHSDDWPQRPDERVGAWTRDLMQRSHPTFKVDDFTVVEDTKTRRIVSSMNLISQTWSYAGIPFGVGRPELVGTLPEYRNRGLVRAQFEVIHRWSAERGQKVQAITGIPYYYRLFGYEMAINLNSGRAGYRPNIPFLKEGEREPYEIRPALEADLGFISALYAQGCRRSLVSCIWDEALWRYELSGKSDQNVNRMHLRIIETLAGDPVGFFAHPIMNWGSMMATIAYEVLPGCSLAAITPTVIRYLHSVGEIYAVEDGGKKEDWSSFGFWLGGEHPVYEVLEGRLPFIRKPYAYYIRVPDLPDFLRHIRPVLEQRLSTSAFSGYSGELKLTFYHTGLRLLFEKGRLITVGSWKPVPQGHSGQAAFPGLTFLQMLFGYRSLEELAYAFPDCSCQDEIWGLLKALFPKQDSDLWPIS